MSISLQSTGSAIMGLRLLSELPSVRRKPCMWEEAQAKEAVRKLL